MWLRKSFFHGNKYIDQAIELEHKSLDVITGTSICEPNCLELFKDSIPCAKDEA